MDEKAGFKEVPHTADWELQVWAPDLASLLKQAARGMYTLCGLEADAASTRRHLELEAADAEILLVDFLSELLYLAEEEGLAFGRLDLELQGLKLNAELTGGPIQAWNKEIKAVTYHRLAIQEGERGLEVNIVFDV